MLAIAASKSDSESMMSKWVTLLDETLNSEMDLHRNFCKDFGISEEELENTNAVSSTRDYTNFLLKNAENNSIDSIAISLLPCQWGYSEIGKGLFKKSSLNPDTFHYKWIESYNSQEYQEVTDWLITFVNSIGKNIDKDNVEIFSELFKRGIEFEIDFWESAWLLKKN